MNDQSPQERFGGAAIAADLPSPRTALKTALLGALAALAVSSGQPAAPPPVLTGVGSLIGLVAVVAHGAVRASRTELRCHRDHLTYDPGGLSGFVRGPTAVDYEDVDLVLRRDTRADALVGAGSYDLVRSGAPTVRLRHLADPEGVERALDRYVPAPRERVDAVDDETVRTALQHARVAWRRWPGDEPLPRSAVVTDAALVDRYDRDERVATPESSGAGDATPTHVTAADFENGNFPGGGSGGDADFTGGSPTYSPGHASNEGGAEEDAEGGYASSGH